MLQGVYTSSGSPVPSRWIASASLVPNGTTIACPSRSKRSSEPRGATAFVTGAVAWLALERPDDRPILEPVRDPHPHELAAARRRREPHLDGERLIWGKPAAEALAPLGQRLSGLPAGDLHLCLELVEPPGWGCIVAEATAGLAEPCVVRTGVIAWRGNMEQLGIGAKGREHAGEHASLPVAPARAQEHPDGRPIGPRVGPAGGRRRPLPGPPLGVSPDCVQ